MASKTAEQRAAEAAAKLAAQNAPQTDVEVEEGLTADQEVAQAEIVADPDGTPEQRAAYLEEVARVRKMRKPFGATPQKLALPTRPGFHRHWFNDVAGRIDEAENNGWSKIKKDGQPVKRVVGTGRDNGALVAYAMEIPLQFWQEDVDARHQVAKERMDDVKKKMPAQASAGPVRAEDADKFYNPKGGDRPSVSVSESLG